MRAGNSSYVGTVDEEEGIWRKEQLKDECSIDDCLKTTKNTGAELVGC